MFSEVFKDIENILRGKTGRNLQIGIISAENEMGKTLPDAINNERNERLRRELSQMPGVKIYPIQGNYGGVNENSFLTTGLSVNDLSKVASEYRQESFIHGSGRDDDMTFHLMSVINSEDEELEYEPVQVRNTFMFKADASRDYSVYKGVKFTIPFYNNNYIKVRWNQLTPQERGEEKELDKKEDFNMQELKDRLQKRVEKYGINFFLDKACDDCDSTYYGSGKMFDRCLKKYYYIGVKRPIDGVSVVDIFEEPDFKKKMLSVSIADKKFADTWEYPKNTPRKYVDSVNPNEYVDEKIINISSIKNLIESLKVDEKEQVKIKVKHSDLLEIPEGKNFWQVSFKHYADLVDKKGYAKVIRALNNIKTWNKDEHPSISQKADSIMNKLHKKFRPENESYINDINNVIKDIR